MRIESVESSGCAVERQQRSASLCRGCVECGQCFSTGDRVVSCTTMQEVVTQAAVHGVVAAEFEWVQRCRFVQRVCDVDIGRGILIPLWHDVLLLVGCAEIVQQFRLAIAAGGNDAIVAQNTVITGSTKQSIVAVAAKDVVVLAKTEQHVVARHPVDDVVAGFTVSHVVATDICSVIAGCIVQQVDGSRNDRSRAAVVIISERQEAISIGQLIDVGIVAHNVVGVASVSCC